MKKSLDNLKEEMLLLNMIYKVKYFVHDINIKYESYLSNKKTFYPILNFKYKKMEISIKLLNSSTKIYIFNNTISQGLIFTLNHLNNKHNIIKTLNLVCIKTNYHMRKIESTY